jgi:hypothetical protein
MENNLLRLDEGIFLCLPFSMAIGEVNQQAISNYKSASAIQAPFLSAIFPYYASEARRRLYL